MGALITALVGGVLINLFSDELKIALPSLCRRLVKGAAWFAPAGMRAEYRREWPLIIEECHRGGAGPIRLLLHAFSLWLRLPSLYLARWELSGFRLWPSSKLDQLSFSPLACLILAGLQIAIGVDYFLGHAVRAEGLIVILAISIVEGCLANRVAVTTTIVICAISSGWLTVLVGPGFVVLVWTARLLFQSLIRRLIFVRLIAYSIVDDFFPPFLPGRLRRNNTMPATAIISWFVVPKPDDPSHSVKDRLNKPKL